MNTPSWQQELMDKFCVMFERADRETEPGDWWAESLETFIRTNFIPREKVKEVVEGMECTHCKNPFEHHHWRIGQRGKLYHLLCVAKAKAPIPLDYVITQLKKKPN